MIYFAGGKILKKTKDKPFKQGIHRACDVSKEMKGSF